MLRSLAALAGICLGCASAPQVVPAAFSTDAKLAIAGFHTDALPQGSFGLPEAYAAFRHDLTGCARGNLLGDDVVMATESYRRMLHRLAAETWLEIPNGRLDAAGAAAMGRDADAAIIVSVDLVPYFVRGTKVQGLDTAQIAVSASVSAYDRRGHKVWADEVSAYSPRFSTKGVYQERLGVAATTAMRQAASSLIARLCNALQVH